MSATNQIANLLANENLTVQKANTRTASFNTKTRVLILPTWAQISKDEEDTLIGHEVGHALFTTGDEWVKAIHHMGDAEYREMIATGSEQTEKVQRAMAKLKSERAKRIFKGYINVVEDARIEKLMKRRYPGLRKTFFAGYKSLMDRDFFKINGIDVNSLSLIDRINLFFKVGSMVRVTFSREEMVFVNRIENQETMDDMLQIAQDLYEFSKNLAEEQKIENDHDFSSGDEEGESFEYDGSDEDDSDEYDEDQDGEYDENGDSTDEDGEEGDDPEDYDEDGDPTDEDGEEDSEDGSLSSGKDSGEEEDDETTAPESLTERNLSDSLEQAADSSISYQYMDLVLPDYTNHIIGYKQILEETNVLDQYAESDGAPLSSKIPGPRGMIYLSPWHHTSLRNHYIGFERFMANTDRVVSYLVKEFEMKKAADAHKRTSVSKTGSLNTKKLYQYKLTDDIFKRISVVKDGKNHGMVFLLDWSGSMQQVIKPTLEQIVNLTMFCRRINIPFEVFAFTSSYPVSAEDKSKRRQWQETIFKTRDELGKNIIVSDDCFKMLNLFSSKMTTNEFKTMAKRFTSQYVNTVYGYELGSTPLNEGLSFMLNYIPEYKRANAIEKLAFITLTDGAGDAMNMLHTEESWASSRKAKQTKKLVNDPVTGKTYNIGIDSQSHTNMLLSMISERYDVSNIGFYITRVGQRELRDSIFYNTGKNIGIDYITKMKDDFKKKGFHSVSGCGRDELFIIPSSSTQISDDKDIGDVTKLSASSIARKLSKLMSGQRTSRILLDRFVDLVA